MESGECRTRPLACQRAEALSRLVALLESVDADGQPLQRAALDCGADSLSQLSRLRAAHATYALASGVMQRVGVGAWSRRPWHDDVPHNRPPQANVWF